MRFRLVPKSVTLNDLERRNGPYIALFHRIRVRYRHKTITSVSKSTFFPLKSWLELTYPLLIAASLDTFCLVARQR